MIYLGIDIGGSYIKYAVLDNQYRILKAWRKETGYHTDKDTFYDYMCKDIDCRDVECIGISVPGRVHPDSLQVLSRAADTIAVLYGTNIREEVEKRLFRPVQALNDAKAAAYCELKMGNGRNTSSSAYWLIGTGIGGCICYGGEILSGIDGIAGEFSHIPIAVKNCKTRGIGDIASVKALVATYNQNKNYENHARYGKEVCQKYLAGDPEAIVAMEEWIQNHVQGLYILTSVFNPEVICIGGGISEEEWFVEKLVEAFEQTDYRFSHLLTTKIIKCMYSNDANVIGAVRYGRDFFGK
ncbi:ROK family protein [Ohessyouella blattaphilus]|uniref:ROK family protein n=1 Tax=Ohessyouella blattaphilus TaxID=2949333 RepID=A0ABT1EKP4_9FIRM|nr:ROK family protein [Ohessyouella blattaphilus]MCP1111277.1 ROK family protein [Ohessyouella blattaphilus]MCR8564671.1 ROK family protein [Ohessyouella blattaphilus]MDL2249718.1 ROK family protein [Lachnospiraceae bacterium OttesenSCG-928-J05]